MKVEKNSSHKEHSFSSDVVFLKHLYDKNNFFDRASSSQAKIPKIIHQIWLESEAPPAIFKESQGEPDISAPLPAPSLESVPARSGLVVAETTVRLVPSAAPREARKKDSAWGLALTTLSMGALGVAIGMAWRAASGDATVAPSAARSTPGSASAAPLAQPSAAESDEIPLGAEIPPVTGCSR